MTVRSESGAPAAPPGWYPDPARTDDWRWYDGSQWTHHASRGTAPERFSDKVLPTVPRNRPQWITFAISVLAGLAIWIPTMATHPLYSDGVHEDNGSGWLFPLTLLAAVILAAIFSRSWRVVALGVMLPMFLLSPWTTPRGDNDGLWGLIFPLLGFVFVFAHILAALSALATERIRSDRRGPVGS